jgi:hypothetical protein
VRPEVLVEDEPQRVDGVGGLRDTGFGSTREVEGGQALDADLLHRHLAEGLGLRLETLVGLDDDHRRRLRAGKNRVNRLEQLPVHELELVHVVRHADLRAERCVGVVRKRDGLAGRAVDVRVVRQQGVEDDELRPRLARHSGQSREDRGNAVAKALIPRSLVEADRPAEHAEDGLLQP